jgi:hypothetical protein|tara:strand:- start:242 stop:442 length:201 start_codon:yes stop_codon:yes gene_type:complete
LRADAVALFRVAVFLVFRGVLVRVVAPRFAVLAVFRFFAIRAVAPLADRLATGDRGEAFLLLPSDF